MRVDELYPWPGDELAAIVDAYPNARGSGVGAGRAEEHGRVDLRRAAAARVATGNMLTMRYVGRPERASPAEGYKEAHDVEQERIVAEALTAPAPSKRRVASRSA